MKKYVNVLFLLILPILWNCAFIHWCIKTRNDVPLVEAVIPEETLAFLDSLNNRFIGDGSDHLIIHRLDSIDTNSWNNTSDFGYNDSNGFYTYEIDSLFVIYADCKDYDLVEKTRQFALSAITPMKQVMGQYVYPYMVNGRKLSLYICSDENMYQKACQGLANSEYDYSNTWGLCVYRYSGVDVMTLGITLNYGSMKRNSSNPELDLQATIWHEMNHYVYFQSIDLSQEITMHTWIYEGLAEYFSSNVKRQTLYLTDEEKNAVYTNDLRSSFSPFIFNYSGGELFYDYLESRYGENELCEFIQDIYSKPLDGVLAEYGTNLEQVRLGWVRYIENNYIEK